MTMKILKSTQTTDSEDKNIIYRNSEKINSEIDTLQKAVNILNTNYHIIKQYNEFLTPKIAYLHSFARPHGKDYYDLLRLVKIELTSILDKANPFNSPEMADKFANDLNKYLHLNTRDDANGNTYLFSEGTGGNIKTIIAANRKLVDSYISFNAKADKYEIAATAEKQITDKHTKTATTDKQKKTLEILQQIDDNMMKLNELGVNFINVNHCRRVPFATLYRYI